MKEIQKIPVTITISRETGQVVAVESEKVTEETFRQICRELMKIGRKERKEAEE